LELRGNKLNPIGNCLNNYMERRSLSKAFFWTSNFFTPTLNSTLVAFGDLANSL
jgi:hypothetical protein